MSWQSEIMIEQEHANLFSKIGEAEWKGLTDPNHDLKKIEKDKSI